jgi:hypothetical protein
VKWYTFGVSGANVENCCNIATFSDRRIFSNPSLQSQFDKSTGMMHVFGNSRIYPGEIV